MKDTDSKKEAQAKQEPEGYTWTDFSGKSRHIGKAPPSDGAYNIQPLYLAPQHHPEQPREMVATADVPLPEPHHIWRDPDEDAGAWVQPDQPSFIASQVLAHREAYAKAVVAGLEKQFAAAERERCAQKCERRADSLTSGSDVARLCARDIRNGARPDDAVAMLAARDAEVERLSQLLARALPMLKEHADYSNSAPVWHCTGYEANTLNALIPEIDAALSEEVKNDK